MAEKVKRCELESMPGWELKHFCLWVAKATEEYFKDPDVQRRFKEYQEEQAAKARLKAEGGAAT